MSIENLGIIPNQNGSIIRIDYDLEYVNLKDPCPPVEFTTWDDEYDEDDEVHENCRPGEPKGFVMRLTVADARDVLKQLGSCLAFLEDHARRKAAGLPPAPDNDDDAAVAESDRTASAALETFLHALMPATGS